MPNIALVIGTVASVVGTVASISSSNRAARARRQQETLTRRRTSRQAIRESQIRRAQAVSTARGAGAGVSSGASGGIGSLTSQVGEQLGYASQYSALSNIVTTQMARADMWSGVANLGGGLMSYGMAAGGKFPWQRNRTPTPNPNRPPMMMSPNTMRAESF